MGLHADLFGFRSERALGPGLVFLGTGARFGATGEPGPETGWGLGVSVAALVKQAVSAVMQIACKPVPAVRYNWMGTPSRVAV